MCLKGNFTHCRRAASLYILYSPTTLYALISLWHLLFFNVFVTLYSISQSSFLLSICYLTHSLCLIHFIELFPRNLSQSLSFHHPNPHSWQSLTPRDITILPYSYCCLVTSSPFATPWTESLQAPLSMGFSRQEYWSGLPFPCSGDLLPRGSNSTSHAWQPPGKLSLFL